MEDSGFVNRYDQTNKLHNSVDNFSVDSFSSESYTENMQFIDQSVQTRVPEINTFTISFRDVKRKDEILQFSDSIEHEAAGTTKVQSTTRNPIQAKDHVLAERKRREKLNRHFISLSSLLPNLKKMDKATLLEDASKYIKELQSRVIELERLQGMKRKVVRESVISMKRSRLISESNDENSWYDETNSLESSDRFKPCPEIQVQMSESNVFVRIQCQKDFSYLVKALNLMQNLGISIISSSAMPFAKTTLLITIIAQTEDNVCMTTAELVKKLQLVI